MDMAMTMTKTTYRAIDPMSTAGILLREHDNMLHDIRRALDAWDSSVLEKPRDGRLQESMECLRETFNGIIADEINEANGGAVCRMTANGQHNRPASAGPG